MTLHKVVIEGYFLRRRDLSRTRFVLGIVNCELRIATLTPSFVTFFQDPSRQTTSLHTNLV